MTSAQDYLFKYSKWLIFLLAYLFLGYKLVTFDGYGSLLEHFSSVSLHDYLFLFFVFLLLPLNLLFEALKWQKLVTGLQPISLGLAFQSVLVGQTGAFFTPNRIGEFPARALMLNKQNMIPAVALGFVGSAMQMLVITLFGLITTFLYISNNVSPLLSSVSTVSWVVSLLLVLLVIISCALLFGHYKWFYGRLSNSKWQFLNRLGEGFAHLSFRDAWLIFSFSALRYFVYSSQFYAMLLFMNVTLTPWQALLSIPTIYLLVTYTPSFAFSEAMVRGSYAILIFSAFSTNDAGMALASILLWCINYCLPMLVGSFFVKKSL
jgi:hypothetical protein